MSASLPLIEIGQLFPNHQQEAHALGGAETADDGRSDNEVLDSRKRPVEAESGADDSNKKRCESTASNTIINNSNDDPWERHYEQLKVFQKENGHCRVPLRYSESRELNRWVSHQKLAYRHVTDAQKRGEAIPSGFSWLTEERMDRLNALGFRWTGRKKSSMARENADSGITTTRS